MTIRSIRILCKIEFPSKTIRMWDGSGPFLDLDGEVWAGCVLNEGLDLIEAALNGEAAELALSLSGIQTNIANVAYQETDDGDVIGSRVQILIQDCDEFDQPVGSPEVRYTGFIDDIDFDDFVANESPISTVTITTVNRFSLRRMSSGVVLSDTDQKARSDRLNPSGTPDRFAERVPTLNDKTVDWPKYT